MMSSGLHAAIDALPAGGALGGARFQSWGGRVAAILLVPIGLSLFGTFFLLHEQGTAMKMGVHQFWCLLFLAWAALHVLSKLDGRFTLYVDNKPYAKIERERERDWEENKYEVSMST